MDSNVATQIADIVSEDRLRESFRRHATLAQLNRMWQFQERPASGLDNLLDMMTSDVVIHSSHLDVRGHHELRAAMAGMPIGWRAAHVLKEFDISVDAGETRLEAAIGYLTAGAHDAVSTAEAHYTATFAMAEGVLPKLARIDVSQDEAQPGGEFMDMFAEHRVRSAVHYFFALVEDPSRDPEPVLELLCEDFRLDFTTVPIDSHRALREWVAGPLSSVIASEHDIHSIDVREVGLDAYDVEIRMKSQAMFPDRSGAISRNTQRWRMTDVVRERFPRISRIEIERDGVVRFDARGQPTG